MRIGILSLQGAIQVHEEHFRRLGVETHRVLRSEDFLTIDGLVLPGGESTTMFYLIQTLQLEKAIQDAFESIPFWGICAGSILMSSKLEDTNTDAGNPTLKLFPVHSKRNAYGRQLESFTDWITLQDGEKIQSTFIRAPSFVSWGKSVEVKAWYKDKAVYLENEKHMVTSFHPELSSDLRFHRRFLKKCEMNKESKLER